MQSNDLNALFESSQAGNQIDENRLFSLLHDRFLYLTRLRVWDPVQAEEIVQSAMLIVSRDYKSLVITLSFAAWAHKVLDNKIKDYIRVIKREKQRMDPEYTSMDILEGSSIDPDLKIRLLDCLRKIGSVNRRYARILNYHNIGYEPGEICVRLNLKEGSMYTLLHRSRAMLKKCLETGRIK